ncbi:MAG: hypothetical protein TUN42_09235 [Dehalogenimonas sp.]
MRKESPINSRTDLLNLRDFERKLSEQLRNSFVVSLLMFWASTIKATAHRPPLGVWFVGSFIMFLLAILMTSRKKFRFPKLRWIIPFMAVAFLWLGYWLTGVGIPSSWYKGFAIILLCWTIPILTGLVVIMAKGAMLGGAWATKIERFINWGEPISWWLMLIALFFGVISGWARLINSGMQSGWMAVLLLWGIVIVVAVYVQQLRRVGSK